MNLIKNIFNKENIRYLMLFLILFLIISFLFLLLFHIFSRAPFYKNNKEGFSWNKDSTNQFLLTQHTINPQKIFDVDIIQENQASQKELDYFNKYGHWPWSQETKDLYVKALNKNPYVRTSSKDSLDYAMTIYNETAILRILSYQTKEGEFLLNGVLVKDPSGNPFEELPNGFGDFPYTSYYFDEDDSGLMEDKTSDLIKCNMSDPAHVTLERTTYTGKGGIFGEQTSKVKPIEYNELENIIPGFSFINKPCNPCVALNKTPDYSCPFKIKVKQKSNYISDIWKKLWNLNNDTPLET